MSRNKETLAPDYFEGLYASDIDPWKFATSAYERDKYAETLASLPRPRYLRGLEIGCSIGVLTAQLAPRCDRLLAVDVSATALADARRRCQSCSNVEFAQMFAPREWPEGEFDLILLSEVVYYLDAHDVAALAARVSAALTFGGHVVLVHWTGETNYPLSGDEAAELFISCLGHFVETVGAHRFREYRLDVLARR